MTDITVKSGNDFSVVRYIKDSAGDAVDLTGMTVASEVRAAVGGELVATLTSTISDAVTGEVTLSATAVQTDAWPIGKYKYDIYRTDGTTARNTNASGFSIEGVVTNV